MDRFHTMQVFVTVADCGGFAAASRRLHLSPPAVTRAIAALEETLGVKLFERSTRHVRLTQVGDRYLDDCRRILTDIEAADEAITGMVGQLKGTLAITAPVLFGGMYVMPAVVDFLALHPQMQIDLLLLDRIVNLLEEGMDMGVRIGHLEDAALHALAVGKVRWLTCAAPAYLAQKGVPAEPQALQQHRVILTRHHLWRYQHRGKDLAVKLTSPLTVNTNDAAITAAEQGFGIVRLLSYQLTDAITAGRLEPILQDFAPPALPIHLLHRGGRFIPAKVRAFIDFLADRLRHDPRLLP